MNHKAAAMVGLVGLSWWMSASGCSENDVGPVTVASTALVATGAGGASPCFGDKPDGFCAAYAAEPESCACADCAPAAVCTAKCADDGKCDFDAGEDCTCKDCFFKSSKCNPSNGGCGQNDGGVCSTAENCTCPDCTNTEYCKSHCEDNGECVPYFEGCSCADCKSLEMCGGKPSAAASTASSSAATSGAGGGGGAGGAG